MAIVRVTAQKAKEYTRKNRAKLDAMYKKAKPAPFVDDGQPPKIVARGFANFQEYLKKRNSRLKSQDKKVPIAVRLPETVVAKLRTNKQYSRFIAEYIMKGLSSGKLHIPSGSETKTNRLHK